MKDDVVIVNTARGAVMDEDALVKALNSGKVRSVGLDVYEDEPKVHQGLIDNPNVMLLPHLGTFTVEVSLFARDGSFDALFPIYIRVISTDEFSLQTQTKMEVWTLDNIRSALTTGELKSQIWEQKQK